jgi:hypothetical protein
MRGPPWCARWRGNHGGCISIHYSIYAPAAGRPHQWQDGGSALQHAADCGEHTGTQLAHPLEADASSKAPIFRAAVWMRFHVKRQDPALCWAGVAGKYVLNADPPIRHPAPSSEPTSHRRRAN